MGAIALPETTALIIGRSFGKHNFSYFISPKKTLEGLVGQFLGVIPFMLAVFLYEYLFFSDYPKMNYWGIFLQAMALICVQIPGDLMESVLKRALVVKNSSQSNHWGSGIGGILDKFDSFGVGFITMSLIIQIFFPRNIIRTV
jgi:phosphatidate cytidylyltransferase